MIKEIKRKQIAKNLTLSLFAQIVSLSVNFILGFILPKFINEYQYAHWHTFLLYLGYVGILHFGLLDGLVLRYSQYDYEEIDKPRIRSQFIVLLGLNSVAFLILIIIGIISCGLTKTIAILVAFGIFTKNIFTYNSYLFQITNRINKYALIVISQRLIYGIIVVLLIITKQQNFIWYCLADLAGDCAGIVLSLFSNNDLHFGKLLSFKEMLEEALLNISSGFLLMIANWSSMLLVSGSKMIIEWKWGALIFGQASFAFSVSQLFLMFVGAISVVLFPSLKRMNKDFLPSFYIEFRNMLMPLLFFGLLFYYPECWLLQKWLPNYSDSLIALGLLSPLFVYMSIVSLLTNNYLKAYRKEKALLLVNVISCVFAVVLYLISAYFFDSLTLLLLAVVFVIMLRSILSELLIAKLINIKLNKEFLLEFFMTSIFLVSVQFNKRIVGFFFYFTFLVSYLFIKIESLKMIVNHLFTLLRHGKMGK